MNASRVEVRTRTRDSKAVLSDHKNLKKRLQDLHNAINAKNSKHYNLETRLENLDIFEQHLTSLNLRCEFLDKQVSNLENKKNSNVYNGFSPTNFNTTRNMDFNSKIELKTTETTLNNLSTEFSYLKEQFSIANEQMPIDSREVDETVMSQMSLNRSTSIFSDSEAPSMYECYPPSAASQDTFNHEFEHATTVKTPTEKKATSVKKLMKMESFLNFNQEFDIPDTDATPSLKSDITPIKGFKINTTHDNPFFDPASEQDSVAQHCVKPKLSTKSLKRALSLAPELPCIDEYEEDVTSCDERADDTFGESDDINEVEILYGRGEQFPKDHLNLKRHVSMPLSNYTRKRSSMDPIKHFASYDNGLNTQLSPFLTDMLFVSNSMKDTNDITSAPATGDFDDMLSSSPCSKFTTSKSMDDMYPDLQFGASQTIYDPVMDETHQEDTTYYGHQSSDSTDYTDEADSINDYGSATATPILVRRESKLSLHRCKSQDSIFSTLSRKSKLFPLREKNLDLKAQTMKWLKPNQPLVSSSVQPVTPRLSKDTTNAHDGILNLLNSGVKTFDAESTQEPSAITPTKTQEPYTPKTKSSWIPFASPISVTPLFAPTTPTKNNSAPSSDAPISSWISSFIPNSAFTNPEIGKLLGRPAQKPTNLADDDVPTLQNVNNSLPKNIKFQKNYLSERAPIFNGPSSSLTIGRNGSLIMRHGYGSGFNKTNALSSKVSHSALREALNMDMDGDHPGPVPPSFY